mmetsp:Transcript_38309/g.36661  ORF Transcript_38309/g.36661 Transcript_38309/m.36661 type:complete len:101 (+) Transcript_38309:335-637(+)
MRYLPNVLNTPLAIELDAEPIDYTKLYSQYKGLVHSSLPSSRYGPFEDQWDPKLKAGKYNYWNRVWVMFSNFFYELTLADPHLPSHPKLILAYGVEGLLN